MSSNTTYHVHPQGICETRNIGSGSRVWAFAHILSGAILGADCNICDGVFIEDDVVLGDRVTVKNFVALYNGLRAENDVFIGPGVSFANDRFPRSKRYVKPHVTLLEQGCSIGAGAVILSGITIGHYALIAAGSVVTRDVAPFSLVMGNPARTSRQVCVCGAPLRSLGVGLECTQGDWRGVAPVKGIRCSAW